MAIGLGMFLFDVSALRAPSISMASIDVRREPNEGLGNICKNVLPVPRACKTANDPQLLVWGDSYAMHLVDGIISSNPSARLVQMTRHTCPPFLNFALVEAPSRPKPVAEDCTRFNLAVLEYLKNTPTIKTVVLSANLNRYAKSGALALVDGAVISSNTRLLGDALLETMHSLHDHGIAVVFIDALPRDGRNVADCVSRHRWFNLNASGCDIAKSDADKYVLNTYPIIDRVREEYPIVEFKYFLCTHETCRVTAPDDVIIYRDEGHLSHEGSKYLGQMLGFYNLFTSLAASVPPERKQR